MNQWVNPAQQYSSVIVVCIPLDYLQKEDEACDLRKQANAKMSWLMGIKNPLRLSLTTADHVRVGLHNMYTDSTISLMPLLSSLLLLDWSQVEALSLIQVDIHSWRNDLEAIHFDAS